MTKSTGKTPRFINREEDSIQEDMVAFLRLRGWTVAETHGNAYQKGLPDLFCWNQKHNLFRWVDMKNPNRYRFTKDQCKVWTGWEKEGLGVWIITAATDEEYQKLFGDANFRDYWLPHYDKYLIPVEEAIAPILEGAPDDDEPVKKPYKTRVSNPWDTILNG